APLAAAPPTSAVLWEVLLNALSNWWTLPFRAVSLPSKKKTLPIEASTTGASTMAPVRAWEVDPRHGALPEAHAPVVLNDSRTYQTLPAVPAAFQSPTNRFPVTGSSTALLRGLVETVTGQGLPASASVPFNAFKNLCSLPRLSPT